MNRIDKLVQELCPEGVRYEPLSGIGEWFGGGTPSKARTAYWENGTIPWISPKDMSGRSIIDSTVDHITEAAVQGSATRLVPANSIAMVVRSSILDRILPTALVPVPAALNQDMKAVVPREDILPGYILHQLRARGQEILRFARKTGGSVSSIESAKLFSFRIPIPPVAVQQEIVSVFDAFATLESELESQLATELDARRRQYAHYRDSLLAFTDSDTPKLPLGEFSTLVRGNGMPKTDFTDSGVAAIHYGQIYTHYGTSATETMSFVSPEKATKLAKVDPGDLVITNTSENLEDVGKTVAWLGQEQAVTGGHATVIKHQQNSKYLAYYFQTTEFAVAKRKYASGTKVIDVSAKSLAKIAIPLPPVSEQERIVAILDKFSSLVNDLSTGLPGEIAARRKQYEYYREKVLTFEEIAA
ncbi:restriction endonuclease subunit S [Arthrobacter sp. A5]|uniref:restriction endonuclease subunit S n=1 Tax=Arthrobacter sp. A5 TaxID=576926 RepID=UPI003DA8D472